LALDPKTPTTGSAGTRGQAMTIHDAAPIIRDMSRPPLWKLFLRPSEFFAARDLAERPYWWIVAWVAGAAAVVDRVDQQLLGAEFGRERAGAAALAGSWSVFWLTVLFGGVVSAAILWALWGRWYRLRIRWSGDKDPDLRQAQLTYVFAGFVSALPSLAYCLYCTSRYPNYRAAWDDEESLSALLSLVIGASVIWSFFVSYRGVRANFDVRPWPARVWFLILPIVFAVLVVFGLGVLFVLAGAGE
jgi:hypothetical protein